MAWIGAGLSPKWITKLPQRDPRHRKEYADALKAAGGHPLPLAVHVGKAQTGPSIACSNGVAEEANGLLRILRQADALEQHGREALARRVVGLGHRLFVEGRGPGRVLRQPGDAVAIKITKLIEGTDVPSIGRELVIGDCLGGVDRQAEAASAVGIAQARVGVGDLGVGGLAEIFEPDGLIGGTLAGSQQRHGVFQRRRGIAGIGPRLEIGLCRGRRGSRRRWRRTCRSSSKCRPASKCQRSR